MQIDASHARKMLAAMEYDCEVLSCLAEAKINGVGVIYDPPQ